MGFDASHPLHTHSKRRNELKDYSIIHIARNDSVRDMYNSRFRDRGQVGLHASRITIRERLKSTSSDFEQLRFDEIYLKTIAGNL